jgi:hypothetical protein
MELNVGLYVSLDDMGVECNMGLKAGEVSNTKASVTKAAILPLDSQLVLH